MQQPAVPQIEWFRTLYVVAEDRLRLSCALAGGDTEVFWLTQRLANALTKQLLAWLDRTVADKHAGPFAHSIEQQSAVAKTPKRRTEQLPDKPGWLVDAINVRTGENGLILTFKDSAEHAVAVSFDAAHLRRWLHVVHTQYRNAGWPGDVWPEWVAEIGGAQADANMGLLH